MTQTQLITNVLIAGASGNLGPAIVQELLSSKRFTVFVLTRTASQATFPDSVKVLKTDYSPQSLESLLSENKIDAVVSAHGMAQLATAQVALIEAAAATGVKRFIPSEFGSDSTDDRILKAVPFFSLKTNAIDHLKRLQSDTFSWTSIVTGIFFDWAIQAGVLAIDPRTKTLEQWDDGEAPLTATNLATIGRAISILLSDSSKLEATKNRYVHIASHTITNNQMIAAVQKVTGESWSIQKVNSDDLLRKENPTPVESIKLILFGKQHLGAFREGLSSNELLGLPKEDLEESVRKALGVKSN